MLLFTRTITVLVMVLMLSHCSNRKVDVDKAIRDPADGNDSLIQVVPLVPAAAITLLNQADKQLSDGLVEDAVLTLKRALSISPSSALVQQHLAEAYLAHADYKQAMYWSTLVVNQGPDQGVLCERSRRTQALAAELLNQIEIQARALESIATCSTLQPTKY
jgi:Tfp pilus assembly protein PilF